MSAEAPRESVTPGSPITVVIGAVTVPELVDRPQIVVRAGTNHVAIDEFARWAEPLKSQIPRVFVADLSQLLNSPRVSTSPIGWRSRRRPGECVSTCSALTPRSAMPPLSMSCGRCRHPAKRRRSPAGPSRASPAQARATMRRWWPGAAPLPQSVVISPPQSARRHRPETWRCNVTAKGIALGRTVA